MQVNSEIEQREKGDDLRPVTAGAPGTGGRRRFSISPTIETREIIGTATPNRKRGKSMSFRSGQSGTVVRKGQMWHGRYYVDIPGGGNRRSDFCAVRFDSLHEEDGGQAEAPRDAEEMGLNQDSHLERNDTRSQNVWPEAAWWRENRLSIFKPSCQETMGSHLDKYLIPRFGSLPIAAIDERRVQEFIADLTRMEYTWPNGVSKKLSPKTIRNIVGVLKQILGEKVWREWSLSLARGSLERAAMLQPELKCFRSSMPQQASGRFLFATLASTGLRCGEAFGLHVEDLDLATGRIYVRRSIWNGKEVSVKTKQGYRAVNIEPGLIVEMLAAHLGDRKVGQSVSNSHWDAVLQRATSDGS